VVTGGGLAWAVAAVPYNRVRVRVSMGNPSPVRLEEVGVGRLARQRGLTAPPALAAARDPLVCRPQILPVVILV
jgi:hypothetical protein